MRHLVLPALPQTLLLTAPPHFKRSSLQASLGAWRRGACDVFAQTQIQAVEWRGMAWNGVEWRGMAWNGVEWRGMVVAVIIRVAAVTAVTAVTQRHDHKCEAGASSI
jgi:hypothetical protein